MLDDCDCRVMGLCRTQVHCNEYLNVLIHIEIHFQNQRSIGKRRLDCVHRFQFFSFFYSLAVLFCTMNDDQLTQYFLLACSPCPSCCVFCLNILLQLCQRDFTTPQCKCIESCSGSTGHFKRFPCRWCSVCQARTCSAVFIFFLPIGASV